jgi:tetratricopeptide (TPR) repeat protein
VLCTLLLYRGPFCAAYFRYWAGVWQNPVEIMLFSSETRPFQFQPRSVLAVLLEAKGFPDQAEKIAKEALAEAPWNPTPRLALARIEETRGNLAGAEECYRIIVDDPKIPGLIKRAAVMELATLLAPIPARSNDAAELLRLYLRNSRSKDGQPKAIALLADVYRNSGDIEKARATLERGLNENPDHLILQAALMNLNRTFSPAQPQLTPDSAPQQQ